jgi:hypothetical protein
MSDRWGLSMSSKVIKLDNPLSEDDIEQMIKDVYSDNLLKDYKDITINIKDYTINISCDNSFKLQRAYDDIIRYLENIKVS